MDIYKNNESQNFKIFQIDEVIKEFLNCVKKHQENLRKEKIYDDKWFKCDTEIE